jgi:hypothetical protein
LLFYHPPLFLINETVFRIKVWIIIGL